MSGNAQQPQVNGRFGASLELNGGYGTIFRGSLDGVRRAKAALFQWVKAPPGELLQPEAPGATMEATKWLKPLGKACHEIR
jgi:hypothetical protein